ncbi:MAG: hypothetical protein IKA74_01065 [Clostridia bacterium]|nr:hypothetical protein [Clostridia bacterium]
MEKGFDAWGAAQRLSNSAADRVRRSFGDYVNEICLAVCIIFTVAIPLVTVRFVNPLSPEFLANTVYMVISTYTCYLVFIPSGKRDELANGGYNGNTVWEALCDKIREGSMITEFCAYCEREAQREAKDSALRLASLACIDGQKYLSVYAPMKKAQLKQELSAGRITKEQYRILRRANSQRVRPISASLILSRAKEVSINDAGRKSLSYEQSAAMRKPFLILISSVSLACAVLIPTKTFGVAVIVSIISRIFGICMASFAGYNVGVRQIRWENARTDGKILFIRKFLERTKSNEEV